MKPFKITAERIIIAILLLILIIGFLTYSSKMTGKNKEIATLELTAKLEKQTTDSIINAKGQKILVQEAVITNSQYAFRQVTDSLFNLTAKQSKQIKEIVSFYKGVTNTVIQEFVPYEVTDSPEIRMWQDSIKGACKEYLKLIEANTITVPKSATIVENDFYGKFTATKAGILIDSVSIIDSQYIRMSKIKGGFMKKDTHGKRHFILGKRYRVDVLHSNSRVNVIGQNSIIYQPDKKLNLLPKAILIGIGVFIGTKL